MHNWKTRKRASDQSCSLSPRFNWTCGIIHADLTKTILITDKFSSLPPSLREFPLHSMKPLETTVGKIDISRSGTNTWARCVRIGFLLQESQWAISTCSTVKKERL
jgi:hypothetical protein